MSRFNVYYASVGGLSTPRWMPQVTGLDAETPSIAVLKAFGTDQFELCEYLEPCMRYMTINVRTMERTYFKQIYQ